MNLLDSGIYFNFHGGKITANGVIETNFGVIPAQFYNNARLLS